MKNIVFIITVFILMASFSDANATVTKHHHHKKKNHHHHAAKAKSSDVEGTICVLTNESPIEESCWKGTEQELNEILSEKSEIESREAEEEIKSAERLEKESNNK